MNKRILLFLIIFSIFPSSVFSIKTFVIQETEKISLQAKATDPDANRLVTIYTPPLNENGEWQTNYGDAGKYKVAVTVSDGRANVSEDVMIIVKKKEEPPKIESFIPTQVTLSTNEGESIKFGILASDVNKDNLSYEWSLDNRKAKDGQEFSYETTYKDAGNHKISVKVSDGKLDVYNEWDVTVANIDVEGLLNEIKDVAINENDIARLSIPDFEKYGLTYSISEPLGNKNEWKTSYNDSGSYEVILHAEGKGFSGDKIAKVFVNDVDRPPIFEKLENRVINENEEMNITLIANDPDDDEITYSANNLPVGAKLEGNIFTWRPSYDTISKKGYWNRIISQFRTLSRNFNIKFTASSRGEQIAQDIVIIVKDMNSAPVIEDIAPISINEEETLKIVPKVYDLDGDKVRLSYSGFINKDTYKSNFRDSGNYSVKVTASDEILETSKFVDVNIKDVNRYPIFRKMHEIKASEDDKISLLLEANDPDGDEVSYSIDNPPEDSSLERNTFFWTPSYDLVNKKEIKKFDLVFVASDGKSETKYIVNAQIADKNRAPKIINSTKSVLARVNEPVLMFVKATDEDGDELTYTWGFGLLEKYKATSTHQRIFTIRGTKIVKVIVSDGVNKVEQLINVNVI